MMNSLLSVGSPAGVPIDQPQPLLHLYRKQDDLGHTDSPSVMAITSKGFWSCLCRAGPSNKGCSTFWSKAVPSGVRPVTRSVNPVLGSGGWKGRTAELDLLDDLQGSLFGVDIVSLHLGVEESDLAKHGFSTVTHL